MSEYDWFLEMTDQPKEALHANFEDKAKRENMFRRARAYGDRMFELLRAIDEGNPEPKFFRHLVI